MVKFFVDDMKMHLLLALEIKRDKYEVERDDLSLSMRHEGFFFPINNKDINMLTFLWSRAS